MPLSRTFMVVAVTLLVPSHVFASNTAADSALVYSIQWVTGPARFHFGNGARIWVPDSFQITNRVGVERFLKAGHIAFPDDDILAIALPTTTSGGWIATFRYIDGGYVSDSGELSPDSILAAIKIKMHDFAERPDIEGGTPFIDGWQEAPYYDRITHSLAWTIHITNPKGAFATHSVRVLGRRGHIHADLQCRASVLQAALPKFAELMRGVAFEEDYRYTDHQKGDKLAPYSLSGIVAGEVAAIAARRESRERTQTWIIQGLGLLVTFFAGRKAVQHRRSRRAAARTHSDETPA